MKNVVLVAVLMSSSIYAYDPRFMSPIPNTGAYPSNWAPSYVPQQPFYPQGNQRFPNQPSYNPSYNPNQGHSRFPQRDMRGIDPRSRQQGPKLEEVVARARAAIQKLDRLQSNIDGSYSGFENEYRQYLYQSGGYAQMSYKDFVMAQAAEGYQKSVQEFVQYFRNTRAEELSWNLTTGEEIFSHVHRLLEKLSSNNQFSAQDFLEVTATKEVVADFLDRATLSDEIRHEIIIDMRKISSIYHDRMGVKNLELMPQLFQHTRNVQTGEVIREERKYTPPSPQDGDRRQRNPRSLQGPFKE